MSIWRTLGSLLNGHSNDSPHNLPPVGLHHYLIENPEERSRIHLRVDADGSGVLLINANRVLHLNQTAVMMAYLMLQKVPEEDAVKTLTQTFRADRQLLRADYHDFQMQLDELTRPDGACPLHELELETHMPFSARPSAPYRMDLALTYRCNNDCSHCYNQRPKDSDRLDMNGFANKPELTTNEWQLVIDHLWSLGIPHIVFTGGEPTLRNDLPELIAYAQNKGQVTGLNTNARRLANKDYIEQLVASGLDHIQITVESHDPDIHDRLVAARGAWKQTVAGMKNALDTPLYVMTNTTLLQDNSRQLSQTLDFLTELGVPTIGLNALIYSGRGKDVGTGLPESDLPPLLEMAQQKTNSAGQRLIWYTPTEYCRFDPMQLELGVKGCTAALYNMCVEPNGDVIPCQSYYQSLGNILHDPWKSIWEHDLSIKLRERHYVAEKCFDCALLAECGGGCPLQIPENGMQVNH